MGEYADLQIEKDMKRIEQELLRELNQDCVLKKSHPNRKPHHKMVQCVLCGKSIKMQGMGAHTQAHKEEGFIPSDPETDDLRLQFEYVVSKEKLELPLTRRFSNLKKYHSLKTQSTWEGFQLGITFITNTPTGASSNE